MAFSFNALELKTILSQFLIIVGASGLRTKFDMILGPIEWMLSGLGSVVSTPIPVLK